MTKAFLWFLLILSGVLLTLGLTNFDTAKPAVLLLWAAVAAFAALKLFGKRGRAPGSTGH